MYCPKCEFEIKQEVDECPICGGVLTELPEEGSDTSAGSSNPEETIANNEKPLDTCISDLILDAKHELDSIDSKPNTEQKPVEPFTSSLDFESMLSEDTAVPVSPAAEPSPVEPIASSLDFESMFGEDNAEPASPAAESSPAEPLLFDNAPETEPVNEDTFLLDDAPGPLPETDAPMASEAPTEPEKPSENLFLEDTLFSKETSAPETPDTNLLIEEPPEKEPESLPGSEVVAPAEQSSSQPWSLDDLDLPAPEPKENIQGLPEEQKKQPDTNMSGAVEFLDDKEEESPAKETEEQPAGGRSKKRPVFLLLFGILIIVGAYFAQGYLPQILEFAGIQKQEPVSFTPPAPVKKTTPAELTTTEPSEALPEKHAPMDIAPEEIQQQAIETLPETSPPEEIQQQAIETQPETSPPEDIPAEKAAEKTEPEQIIETKEEPKPAAEQVKDIQETPPLPDEEKTPAKLPYSIHVSSFKKQQFAEEQIKNLRTDGFNAYLETVDLGGKGIWHRVKVGHYATRTEAKQAIKIIQQKNSGPTPIININR